jgi:hypothetical protein
MDERMPRLGGFISTSGTIQTCTKPDPAKASMPIHFYTPGKDHVYPKTRSRQRIQEYRAAGFTSFKNIVKPTAEHADNKTVDWITEFAEKMQSGGSSSPPLGSPGIRRSTSGSNTMLPSPARGVRPGRN